MQDEGMQVDDAGKGRIELALNGREAVFSELSYRYPLKLLSPRIYENFVAIAYILSYGGGLVSGDRIHLNVTLHSESILLLLTQVSTFLRRTDVSVVDCMRLKGVDKSVQASVWPTPGESSNQP